MEIDNSAAGSINTAVVIKLPAEWVSPASKHDMPTNAIEGGKDGDGQSLYIGRIKHEGSMIPGYIQPSAGICVSSYDTKAISSSDFEVLINPMNSDLAWFPTSRGVMYTGSIIGGRDPDGEQYYIGRCKHAGSLWVGKVHPSHKICYIGFNGSEIGCKEYDLLVVKSICLDMDDYNHEHVAHEFYPVDCSYNDTDNTLGEVEDDDNNSGSDNADSASDDSEHTSLLKWIPFVPNNEVPSDAVSGGQSSDGELLYVGRLKYQGSTIPGYISKGICYSSYDSRDIKSSDFQILTNPYGVAIDWVPTSHGSIPENALVAGYDPNGDDYHVGRFKHDGGIWIGKVHPRYGSCYVGYNGAEIHSGHCDVDVLVIYNLR